jgi:hypothetical protein
MIKSIDTAIKSGNGNAIVYAGAKKRLWITIIS